MPTLKAGVNTPALSHFNIFIGDVMPLTISKNPKNIQALLDTQGILLDVDFSMHNVYWAIVNDSEQNDAAIGLIVIDLDVSSDSWSEDDGTSKRLTQCAFHSRYFSNFNAIGRTDEVSTLIECWFDSIILKEAIDEMPSSFYPSYFAGFSFGTRDELISPYIKRKPALDNAITLLGYSH
jgi:hypothetical protein